MASKVHIGILGAGTVGGAVHDLVVDGHLARFGVDAEVVKVFTRTPRGKPRYETSPELFTTDASEVTRHPDVDIVVEVLAAGGAEELRIQKEWVVDALRHGKSVATANKPLLVAHGAEIWTAARENANVTTIIYSNRQYNILEVEYRRLGINEIGTKAASLFDLSNPDLDWVKLAEAQGVPGTRATTCEELDAQLQQAIEEDGPHLIEAVL